MSRSGIAHGDFSKRSLTISPHNRAPDARALTIAYDGDGNRVSETAGGVHV